MLVSHLVELEVIATSGVEGHGCAAVSSTLPADSPPQLSDYAGANMRFTACEKLNLSSKLCCAGVEPSQVPSVRAKGFPRALVRTNDAPGVAPQAL